ALVDPLAAVLALEVLAHLLEEVRGDRGPVLPELEAKRLGLGLLGLLGRDVLLLDHAVEDVIAPGQRAVGMLDGGEAGRVLGETRDQRRLGQAELPDRLAVEELARGLDPVVAVAEVDLVAVEREDLLLREALLDLEGEDDLLDLALVGLLGGQEENARELHR